MHSPGGAAPRESERVGAVGRALRGSAHPWRFKAVLALFGAGYRAKVASGKALNCRQEDPSLNPTHCQPSVGP